MHFINLDANTSVSSSASTSLVRSKAQTSGYQVIKKGNNIPFLISWHDPRGFTGLA